MASLGSAYARKLVDALFTDGVSTRDEVSDTSGRGVGMSSLRAACQDLKGQIEVVSQEGEGTTFRFRFAHAFAASSRRVA